MYDPVCGAGAGLRNLATGVSFILFEYILLYTAWRRHSQLDTNAAGRGDDEKGDKPDVQTPTLMGTELKSIASSSI